MDQNKIKERIRKLLNLAENDAASEGEIANAMSSATALMAQYQIDKTEIEQLQDMPGKEVYDRVFVAESATYVPWMGILAMAVAAALGSVGVYKSSQTVEVGAFKKLEYRPGIFFYGPEADIALAKEVYEEWKLVVATISVGKYGSFVRADGRAYAIGFCSELARMAKEIYTPEKSNVGSAIVPVVNELARKRSDALAWLETNHKVKLGGVKRSTTSRQYSNAHSQGRQDGRNSGFGVSRTRSLGPKS